MALGGIASFDKSFGPRFVKIIYWIGLLLILLSVVHGVGRGVFMIGHPPPPRPAATLAGSANDAAAPAAANQAATPSATPVLRRPGMFRRGMMQGRGRGMMMRHRRGMMFLRMVPGPARPWAIIVLALVRGLVLVLILRIACELWRAVFSINERLGVIANRQPL